MTPPTAYRGRFAPSPTGPLHAGSAVAALASWLDARAHGGQWLVRVEDVDAPRCPPGTADWQLRQLAALGLTSDEPVWVQSERSEAYRAALAQLVQGGLAYPCRCSRSAIARHTPQPQRPGAPVRYPGTCRPAADAAGAVPGHGSRANTAGPVQWAHAASAPGTPAPAWRLNLAAVFEKKMGLSHSHQHFLATCIEPMLTPANAHLPRHHPTAAWWDRRLGRQQQDVEAEVGDFVLRRADGWWAYQLAVVVDDAAQGITHVVRGEDLADNTPRQLWLQAALGLSSPVYLHTPLVRGASGDKLSKQTGAAPLDTNDPLAALNAAAAVLSLPPQTAPLEQALSAWVAAWAQRWCAHSAPPPQGL